VADILLFQGCLENKIFLMNCQSIIGWDKNEKGATIAVAPFFLYASPLIIGALCSVS